MKADIDAAFRRIPVQVNHRWAAAVAWQCKGEPWVATHIGMPFGAAASGIAWHKVGHLLSLIGRRLLGLPLYRYVDDYFAADRPETVEHGLSTFVRLVRAILGPSSISNSKVECGMTLVILGILVRVLLFSNLPAQHGIFFAGRCNQVNCK
jgi:hypothetical protein